MALDTDSVPTAAPTLCLLAECMNLTDALVLRLPGQVNRLPFFTNHFFDTYLLISEDTPVGELAQALVGMLGGMG